MIEIKVQCKQCKIALLEDYVYVAEGCSDYVKVSFSLCPDWAKMGQIVASFKHGNDQTFSVHVQDGECVVPAEVIKFPEFKMSIFGTDGDIHMTSAILELPILRSDLGQGVPPEPTPNVFDVIMATVRNALETVEDFKKRADSGEFDGKDFRYWKTYLSVADMTAEKAIIPDGVFVNVNTGNVEDADDSKVFFKTGGELVFTADHSGQAGRAATVGVDKTVTEPAGSSASVENVGTDKDAKFLFRIPRGDKGEKGATGATGAPGAQGATGATGAKGDPGAGVASGGSAGNFLRKKTATSYDTEWITIETLKVALGVDSASLLNKFLPVGAIYTSSKATSPASLFGGSWTQIKDRFIYAAGSKAVNAIGGSVSHNHLYSVLGMEYYGSMINVGAWDYKQSNMKLGVSFGQTSLTLSRNSGLQTGVASQSNVSQFNCGDVNTSDPQNGGENGGTLPPFVVKYIWERVA